MEMEMEKYERSIYVGQLPEMFIRSNVLSKYFEKFGKIECVKYQTTSAYMWFDDFSALRGIFEHGIHIVDGHVLSIGLPSYANEIYVTNLPINLPESCLLKDFRKYGQINKITKIGQCAFIKFCTNDGFKSALNVYKPDGENSIKVTVAYRKLMFCEQLKEVEFDKVGRKMHAEALPQIITDRQIRSYFSKFDHIDAFIRNGNRYLLTFASTKGLKKVLQLSEHKSNGTVIYVRPFEHKSYVPYVPYEEHHIEETLPKSNNNGMRTDFGQNQKATCLTETIEKINMPLHNEELSTELQKTINPPQIEELSTVIKKSIEPNMPPQDVMNEGMPIKWYMHLLLRSAMKTLFWVLFK